MDQIYLSRRNLETLLNKLDRVKRGEPSACTIVKCDNVHPTMPQTMAECAVTAVEDADYYIDRTAGTMWPGDDQRRSLC
jgi:hypothetical protein